MESKYDLSQDGSKNKNTDKDEDQFLSIVRGIAGSVRNAQQAQQAASKQSLHQFLRTTLENKYNLDTGIPLYKLSVTVEPHSLTEPIFEEFRKQWDQYKGYLWSANREEAKTMEAVDRNWFESQLKAITFGNVLDNRLWYKTKREYARFDVLADSLTGNALLTSSRSRTAEHFLPRFTSSAVIAQLNGGSQQYQEKKSADAVILTHLEGRRVRARYKMFRKIFAEHISPRIEKLAVGGFTAPKFEFDGLPCHPLAKEARVRLRSQAEICLADLAKITEKKDQMILWREKWTEEMKRAQSDLKDALNAHQADSTKHIGTSMTHYAYRYYVRRWQIPLLANIKTLLDQSEDVLKDIGACADHIESEWPTVLGSGQELSPVATAESKMMAVSGRKRQKLDHHSTGDDSKKRSQDAVLSILADDASSSSSPLTLQEWIANLKLFYSKFEAKPRPEETENLKLRQRIYTIALQHDVACYSIWLHTLHHGSGTLPDRIHEVADMAIGSIEQLEVSSRAVAEVELRDSVMPYCEAVNNAVLRHCKRLQVLYNKKRTDIERTEEGVRSSAVLNVNEPWLETLLIPEQFKNQLKMLLGEKDASKMTSIQQLLIKSSWLFEAWEYNRCMQQQRTSKRK
jgi:hypothetical protein